MVKRGIGERNNGGEEVRTGTVRKVEWNGIELDMVGRRKCGGRGEEFGQFLKDAFRRESFSLAGAFWLPAILRNAVCLVSSTSCSDIAATLRSIVPSFLRSFVRPTDRPTDQVDPGRLLRAQAVVHDRKSRLERWEDLFVNSPRLR